MVVEGRKGVGSVVVVWGEEMDMGTERWEDSVVTVEVQAVVARAPR